MKKVCFYILIIGISIGALICLVFSSCSSRTNATSIFSSSNKELQDASQAKSDLELLIEDEVSKLRHGRILYNIPESMKVGECKRIVVRIEKSFTDDFTKDLENGENYVIEDINVAPLMKIKLVSGNGKFQILEIVDPEQIVIDNYYTQWVWDVTPLKSGQADISLVVSFKINIPDQLDFYQDYVLFEKQVNVKVNPMFSFSSFIKDQWQWLVVTIFIPAIAFYYDRFSKSAKSKRK